MFAKIKKWYYERCLKRELEKMENFKVDPDYYLCVEGSKQDIEIQKTENRILFYQFILYGKCDCEFICSWMKKNYPFRYHLDFWRLKDAQKNRRS